jgi:thiol-disulfide isomerase/thioredoxin
VPDRREILGLVGIGIAAAAAGVYFGSGDSPEKSPAELLKAAQMTDLAGRDRALSEWQGRVLVLNFWATWCPPCREEIPDLVSVRDQLTANGVEFVGIAIDQVDKVKQFAANVRITYPLLVAGSNGLDLMRGLGNASGGLPFTAVFDRQGGLVHRNLGAVKRNKIESQVRGLLDASSLKMH